MKNFDWGGRGLLFIKRFSHLLKSRNNRSRTLFSFTLPLLFFLFSNTVSAQEPRQDSGADESISGPLRIGEKIPDHIWDQEVDLHYFDGTTKTIRFSDLKGKVILFDFWSTGCPSCIAGIPTMEDYQKRYSDDLVVVLVNSKRNKDTPERIANRFKVYKEVYGYTPVLPSILDDTLFTTLFPHNTIPNNTFINKRGEYLVSCMGNTFTDQQVQDVITTGRTDIVHNGMFINQGDRRSAPPVIDTTGVDFLRAFSPFQPQYLPISPVLSYENGHSFFRIVNYKFQLMCHFAFRKELKGFAIHDFVFEDQIAIDLLETIFSKSRINERYCYQLYSKDSITQDDASALYREDFIQRFNLAVKRLTSEVDLYTLELTDAFSKLKTKGGMVKGGIDSEDVPLKISNYPVTLTLSKLMYWLHRPIDTRNLSQEELQTAIDIEIPAHFGQYTRKEQLEYLGALGLKLTPERVTKEHPLFYSTVATQSERK